MTAIPAPDAAAKIGDLAAEAGIRRIHVLAWRDLDDVEAGGSELHAANVCREWAAAGLEVHARTSFAQGHPPDVVRDGYVVRRKAGRYLIFPRAVAAELTGRDGRRDALVEIWNGMPFFSPLWARGPRITFLHHVHGEMWHMVLPDRLARMGAMVEGRIAPLLYRRSRIVTLSSSSRDDMIDRLGLRPDRIDVVPPGIDARFVPAADRAAEEAAEPTVVVVGRLVPSKHVDRLVRVMAEVRRRVPGARLEIVGEGYERHVVERAVDEVGAASWVELAGRVDHDDLVDRYRRAWVLASASSHEGWGMSITEAAACGTPAVVTDIPGHRDAVVHGSTGLLVPDVDAAGRGGGNDTDPLVAALVSVLADPARRRAMSGAALDHAARFSWGATATQLMAVLADDAQRRRR